ncbi:hypothetical protein [Hymenobacter sp. DG25A]|uniref:hypothetical protein n=1 Tax=Hymenobacter sp. DG25A TaxID=1385663 RepID=UPI0006BCB659|nr:hypothetical protein [Hymenobacter sp. DG25A]ALD20842.1 hypothetical protein AM218_05905 [Hymenobacter sp. DG25A]
MLVPVAEYLTYAEAVSLYNQLLNEAEVVALVKNYGPATLPFGDGLYFQLLIEETDQAAAQVVVEEFARQRILPAVLRCPRCGSPDTLPVARPAWWQRVFYAGTTLYRCQNCGEEFGS